MNPFIERHHEKITAVLSCFDRIVITGMLPEIGHAEAMARYLSGREIRLFDYPRWAEPLREELRTHAEVTTSPAALDPGTRCKVYKGNRNFIPFALAPGT